MTTGGISQTGIQSNLINQQMNELKQQSQSKPDKDKGDAIRGSDTVQVTADISDKRAVIIQRVSCFYFSLYHKIGQFAVKQQIQCVA